MVKRSATYTDKTKFLEGVDSHLLAVSKGRYGHFHMGRIDSAIEVLKGATAYEGHNVFTLLRALNVLVFQVFNQKELQDIYTKVFSKHPFTTYVNVSDVCDYLLGELQVLQIFDNDDVIISYTSEINPDIMARLEMLEAKKLGEPT